MRKWLSISLQGSSHQECNLLVPWSGTSRPPSVRNKCLLFKSCRLGSLLWSPWAKTASTSCVVCPVYSTKACPVLCPPWTCSALHADEQGQRCLQHERVDLQQSAAWLPLDSPSLQTCFSRSLNAALPHPNFSLSLPEKWVCMHTHTDPQMNTYIHLQLHK